MGAATQAVAVDACGSPAASVKQLISSVAWAQDTLLRWKDDRCSPTLSPRAAGDAEGGGSGQGGQGGDHDLCGRPSLGADASLRLELLPQAVDSIVAAQRQWAAAAGTAPGGLSQAVRLEAAGGHAAEALRWVVGAMGPGR